MSDSLLPVRGAQGDDSPRTHTGGSRARPASQHPPRKSTTAAKLLEEIRDELAELRRQGEQRLRIEDGTPLSRSEVCRILHIDLRDTLQPLIDAKKIRTVPWTKGEKRIPVAELRRLQREGIPAVKDRSSCSTHRSNASPKTADRADVGAGIRGLQIP